MTEFFQMIWNRIVLFFGSYHWISDTLDILMVALLLFFVIRLVRDSRAAQLIKGIVVLALIYLLSYLLHLTTMEYIMKALFNNGLLVLVVIFQPELRRALEQAGHSRVGIGRVLGSFGTVDDALLAQQWEKAIQATAEAVELLQKQKMGALIVMERSTRLGEIVPSGTLVEADPSGPLIANIFFNKAPLHDGAMIIRDGRIFAAGCILPLTDNLQISRELGTRHRAGVGMSENSDSVVVILSEETGTVSLAEHGELLRNLNREALVKALRERILTDQPETKKPLWQRKKEARS